LIRIYSEAADGDAVEARLRALEDIVGIRQHASATSAPPVAPPALRATSP